MTLKGKINSSKDSNSNLKIKFYTIRACVTRERERERESLAWNFAWEMELDGGW